MAKVVITSSLEKEINKKFKSKSIEIFELMHSLEENPKKGKSLGNVGGLVIKEIKYKSFRFYFITECHKLKFFDEKELVDILLKFIRMSNKKHQQKTINEIKHILRTIGPEGF